MVQEWLIPLLPNCYAWYENSGKFETAQKLSCGKNESFKDIDLLFQIKLWRDETWGYREKVDVEKVRYSGTQYHILAIPLTFPVFLAHLSRQQ